MFIDIYIILMFPMFRFSVETVKRLTNFQLSSNLFHQIKMKSLQNL